MITAQQARDLVATKDTVASALNSINTKITDAANAGLFFIEESVSPETLGLQLVGYLDSLGYDVKYDSRRSILKVKWSVKK
jgi:hypothetical protein